MVYKNYKRDYDYSYSLGAAPTLELLQTRPQLALKVFVEQSFLSSPAMEDINRLCGQDKIPVEVAGKVVNRLSPNENCFVVGVFRKQEMLLSESQPHVILVNPSDMGNAGTIIRTMVGFGLSDLAVISPAADLYHPKAVRSSMGAVFKIRFRYYETFQEYKQGFPRHDVFAFMLDGEKKLQEMEPVNGLYSLVFGNEATGLDPSFHRSEKSVCIGHSREIDSLNLANAVSIAIYEFTKKDFCDKIVR